MASVNSFEKQSMGNICQNPMGEYSAAETYMFLDAVSFAGGYYLALKDGLISVEPTENKTDENWFCCSISGQATPEYVAMHDHVVNLAEQVTADAEETRTARDAVEGMETNVATMQVQTAQAAEAAEAGKDAAAGYAQAADTSRQVAETARDDVNAQVTGFDTHVTDKTADAEASIEAARIAANKAIVAQQDASVQEVKNQTAEYIASKQSEAEAGIEQKAGEYATGVDADIQAVKDAGAAQIAAVEAAGSSQTDAVNAAGQDQKQAVETAGAKQISDINTAGSNQVAAVQQEGGTQVAAVHDAAAEIAADRAQIKANKGAIARTASDVAMIGERLSDIGFAFDTDGGLNIIIYDKEE